MSTVRRVERRYTGPRFADAKVHDAMRVGVVTCRPETRLVDVAKMMVGYGIHSVVVAEVGGDPESWGIVSSLDLAHAADRLDSTTAGEAASSDLLKISSGEPLSEAARKMAEHGVTHLVAVQPDSGQPVGMISARAIAAALAYGS